MSTIKTILYTQKTLKNGLHPVMLYIYEEKPYRLSLGYACSQKDWDAKNCRFNKSYPNAKTKNLNIRKAELLAAEIIDDFIRQGIRFSYNTFKKLFKGDKEDKKSCFVFFQEMIEEKKALGKIGTMKAYKDAFLTLKKYHPQDFHFDAFNYNLLKGLETSLFARGCTGGGIGSRMRSIKAVYYEAIRRGFAKKELNPYSTNTNKEGYSLAKLKSIRNPKALTAREVELLKNFDLVKYPNLANSWRYFMFSFKTFGMNFIDICNLKVTDLINNRINYVRQKTGKSFSILIVNETQEIIEYFNSDKKYLFPIYDEKVHITPIQQKNRSLKVLKKINKDLKIIASILEIETHMTFYTARHSSATTMKRKGIATDIISEALGHSDLSITQHYLNKFENEVLDQAILNL